MPIDRPQIRKLSDAISQSFGSPVVDHVEAGRGEADWLHIVSGYAKACLEAMDCLGEVATGQKFPPDGQTDRDIVAAKLLRACVDHGRALAHLMIHNPADFSVAAGGLHRSQFDHFHRALYLRHKTTDEEFTIFINEDKLVRINGKGKRENVSAKDLAKVSDHLVKGPEAGLFKRQHANSWSSLCGLVHGGRSLLRSYHDDRNQIGCNVPPEIQIAMLRNATGLCLYAVCIVLNIMGLDKDRVTVMIADAQQRLSAIQQRTDEIKSQMQGRGAARTL